MKEFMFDLGNSSRGPIGMVARVKAESAEEALEKLRDGLPDHVKIPDGYFEEPENVEVVVYFNEENIRAEQAEEWDDV